MDDLNMNFTLGVQVAYGPPPDSNDTNLKNSSDTRLKNINIGILIVLFILGIFALLNKKISKRSKWIILISLIVIGIIATVVIKFLQQ